MLLSGVAMAFGMSPKVAFFAAMGFVLTSTAVVAQILAERGDTATPEGQRMVSILLLFRQSVRLSPMVFSGWKRCSFFVVSSVNGMLSVSMSSNVLPSKAVSCLSIPWRSSCTA